MTQAEFDETLARFNRYTKVLGEIAARPVKTEDDILSARIIAERLCDDIASIQAWCDARAVIKRVSA